VKRLQLLFVVLLMMFALACGAGVPRWEYQIVSPPDEELASSLKSLGAAGWEIIAARRATSTDLGGGRVLRNDSETSLIGEGCGRDPLCTTEAEISTGASERGDGQRRGLAADPSRLHWRIETRAVCE
jgi:hypothetical protein